MHRFASVLLATTALIGFGNTGSAADLPVKAPVIAPIVAPFSWTGWYVGGNVGYSWGKARPDFDVAGFTAAIPIPGFVASDSKSLKGVIGGGQLGYNWQVDPRWLLGLETDIQWSGEKGSRILNDPFFLPNIFEGVSGNSATSWEAKIKWFGTVRGRLGYVWDRVLLYATGGLAYGDVSISGVNTNSVNPPPIIVLPSTPFSASKVNTGWTVGGGLEGIAWNPHWSWKVEYLYMDLGHLSAVANTPATPSGLLTVNTKFTDNIVRLGLNYRFY